MSFPEITAKRCLIFAIFRLPEPSFLKKDQTTLHSSSSSPSFAVDDSQPLMTLRHFLQQSLHLLPPPEEKEHPNKPPHLSFTELLRGHCGCHSLGILWHGIHGGDSRAATSPCCSTCDRQCGWGGPRSESGEGSRWVPPMEGDGGERQLAAGGG